MKAFEYVNATDLRGASEALGRDPQRAKLIAGGIDLLGEMKERIIEPDRLVNLKTVPGLTGLSVDGRGLTLGALVTLSEIAHHPQIRRGYTALAEAAESVGSPQIRNVGTIGGNLCQRPRCWYYRDESIKCLKKGGSRCYTVDPQADNKYNAILGGGPSFIVHPSDCATALVALGATVRYQDASGRAHEVPADEFFILPRVDVHRETILKPGDIVTAVHVPAPTASSRSSYIKFKEKDSMDWAVSAVAIDAVTDGAGVIHTVRIALGGVAPKPWRAYDAEAVLKGKKYSPALANRAAQAALNGAKPLSKNAYKVPLTRVLVRRAIEHAATGSRVV